MVAAFSGSTTAATNAGAPRLPRPARRSTGTGDAAAAAGSTRRGGPANAVAALADEGEFELPGDFNFIFICADQVRLHLRPLVCFDSVLCFRDAKKNLFMLCLCSLLQIVCSDDYFNSALFC